MENSKNVCRPHGLNNHIIGDLFEERLVSGQRSICWPLRKITFVITSFCSIVIDGILISATKGVSLFDTINGTSKKAIEKIKNYSRQQTVRSTIYGFFFYNFHIPTIISGKFFTVRRVNIWFGRKMSPFFPVIWTVHRQLQGSHCVVRSIVWIANK